MLRTSPRDASHPLRAAPEVRAIIHDGAHRLVPTVREDNLPRRADSRVGTVPAPQKGSSSPSVVAVAWCCCAQSPSLWMCRPASYCLRLLSSRAAGAWHLQYGDPGWKRRLVFHCVCGNLH